MTPQARLGTEYIECQKPAFELLRDSFGYRYADGADLLGERHAIKLYMRDKPMLKKSSADLITHLMDFVLVPGKRTRPRFCVLDVRRSKLFIASDKTDGLMTIVRAEAACFAEMYRGS